MKRRTNKVPHYLFAVAFCCFSMASLATPKAAEHEDAPVTNGVDVARPKHSKTAAKPQASGKPKNTAKGKPAKSVKSTKAKNKTRAASGKK